MSHGRVVIAIDGPAASGKSSTAARVASELGFRHVDSGALYREEAARRLGVSDIRSAEVTAAVSGIAQLPEVRALVNAQVRAAAARESVVVDGRDMGSVVFPDAQLKIFLTANSGERARRRLHQRLGRGATTLEIARETRLLDARDASDATNTVPAPDAILIDTTDLTETEQVEQILSLARRL